MADVTGSNLNDLNLVASMALRRAAQILINEFSYDGEDPQGVKAYQEDVDYFTELAKRLDTQELEKK
jgi:hypothetical protein